jgi:flagellar biosynthesis protein FlhG
VRDERLIDSVKKQKAVYELYPDSDASNCFTTLAKRIIENSRQTRLKGNIQFFFRRYLEESGGHGV